MKTLALGALFVGLLAACGGSKNPNKTGITIVDGPPGDGSGSNMMTGACSPLTQAGCNAGQKCSWVIDATTPMYVGHTGCVADGSAADGSACSYGSAGATGYDNCVKGEVCDAFNTPGTTGHCKQICDNQGGNPMCDSTHVCVWYARLFSTGMSTPAAAGACEPACNPLTDNDFDGSGSQTKSGTTCGSAVAAGCYGIPSAGTPPATGWSCGGDLHTNPDKNLRHRAECTTATGCPDTDGTIYVNSCNQGYLPLFRESTAVSTTVCIAMCHPLDCYSGNCGGTGNPNSFGASPRRCKNPDIVTGVGANPPTLHEECEYLWREEIDGSGNYLPSATSNTVGFCYDHSQYKYDPTGGNNPTVTLPDCQNLQLHGLDEGSNGDPTMPNAYFGAVEFGCVSSTVAGLGSAIGKVQNHVDGITIDKPRFLYHRVMGTN
jgi:hypothetical protein